MHYSGPGLYENDSAVTTDVCEDQNREAVEGIYYRVTHNNMQTLTTYKRKNTKIYMINFMHCNYWYLSVHQKY